MAETRAQTNDLVYGLDDTPSFTESTFAAIQHVLAGFVGIISMMQRPSNLETWRCQNLLDLIRDSLNNENLDKKPTLNINRE